VKANKSVWLVTHSFPPNAEVGGLRTLGLCRCLSNHEWRVNVLCAEPKTARCDTSLLQKIPYGVNVIRTNWIDLPVSAARAINCLRSKQTQSESLTGVLVSSGQMRKSRQSTLKLVIDWLSWWLHVPDGRSGWFIPALFTGMRRIFREPPQMIFSSAPSWTGHLVGYVLSLATGASLVLDFRDPWCGSAFRSIPYRAHRMATEFLERIVVQRAIHVTCAWDGIRRHLLQRYPELEERITTVLNGFDPSDLALLDRKNLSDGHCVFLHVGSFYGPRSPIPLLAALRLMANSGKSEIADTRFLFLGHPKYNEQPLQDIVDEFGLREQVLVLPTVPQREALAYLKGSHVAMLFGQSGCDELASIPAKTFEYIGLEKPVLAVGCGDEVCGILEAGGCPVWRVNSIQPEEIAQRIAEIVLAFRQKRLQSAGIGADQYTRQKMAERIEKILMSVVKMPKKPASNLKSWSTRCH